MIVDAAAFAVITAFGRDPRVARVGWWWLAFLLLLGPVALGRIDSVMVPIAIVGMLVLGTMPRLAAVLLTIATWIKVWPAALIAAIVVAVRERWTIALTARHHLGRRSAIVALLLGAGANVFSFITEQTGRGLQVESPIGTFWMWDAFVSHSTRSFVYYDQAILTYQVVGPGSATAANLMTPLLAIVTAALLVLGVRGDPPRASTPARLLPPLTLAITTALILFNKVGSPQFVTWLAVPIVFGLTASLTGRGPSFRVPVVLGAGHRGARRRRSTRTCTARCSASTSSCCSGSPAATSCTWCCWSGRSSAIVDAMRREPEDVPATTADLL